VCLFEDEHLLSEQAADEYHSPPPSPAKHYEWLVIRARWSYLHHARLDKETRGFCCCEKLGSEWSITRHLPACVQKPTSLSPIAQRALQTTVRSCLVRSGQVSQPPLHAGGTRRTRFGDHRTAG